LTGKNRRYGRAHGEGRQPFVDVGGDLAHRHGHHVRHRHGLGDTSVVLVGAFFFG
jgi:hypothetical protein